MDQNMKNSLTYAGVNISRTLERFMNNEPMYEKFLMRFPQDKNYTQLEQALRDGDMKEVERSAHTLKGVAANLGMETLQDQLNQMVMLVRKGEEPPEALQPLFKEIQTEYQKLCSILEQKK